VVARVLDGGVFVEETENPEDVTFYARRRVRAQILADLSAALEGNAADVAEDDAIVDSTLTTLTQAQVIAALKQLARHDRRTKRQLDALIRLVVGALDAAP
jgi:hypothetical protein